MAIQTIEQLKKWFAKGEYPTESQFADLIDSLRHKSDQIPLSDVSSLADVLNNKYDATEAQLLASTVANCDTAIKQLRETQENQGMDISGIHQTDELQQEQIDGLYNNIGKAGGIAPLDDGGKVASEYLPSYVDDVVEFEGMPDFTYIEFYGQFDEMPEEYADHEMYVAGADGLTLQYWDEESKVCYIDGYGFVAGKIFSVYRGYNLIKAFAVNVDGVDLSVYGELDENGCAIPVKGKIYVDVESHSIYRWSGSALTQISKPIGLGNGVKDAYPGSAGAQLASQFESFKQSTNLNINDLLTFALCQGEFNLNAIDYLDEPYTSLEEALDSIKGNYLPDAIPDWPSYGSIITFLFENEDGDLKWVKYRAIEGRGTLDDDCFEPDNWELVENSGSSNDSGSVGAGQLESFRLQLNNVKSRLTTVEGTASSNETAISGLSSSISGLSGELTDLDDVVSGTDGVLDRITALEGSVSDKIVFVDVTNGSDNSGCLKGAHTSGVTYNYPTTKFNLRTLPTDGQDMLILTPIEPTLEGTVLRISDPRIGIASTAPAVKISTFNNDSKIFGCTRESSDYYIALRGGYVELVAVNSNISGTSAPGLHWIVRTLVKFSN